MKEHNGKSACFQCKHRGSLPGSAHSQCNHPKIGKRNAVSELFSLLRGGRSIPLGLMVEKGAKDLNIKGDSHGIAMGWFNWPYNFDPTWLENCDGFEEKRDR